MPLNRLTSYPDHDTVESQTELRLCSKGEPLMVQQFQQQPRPASKTRVKAEHRYPVYDLDSSIAVARTIRDQGGGSADQPHLASFLSYSSTKSGAFITRIAAARIFGLVENRDRFLIPTQLARTIIAPEHPGRDDLRARFEAFMHVPLYRSLYERYKDGQLPPEMGFRNALETHYDIPRNRTQLAYRVLMDSADQAGLFEARGGARTHFVAPIIPETGYEATEPWPETEQIRGEVSQPHPELQIQVDQMDPMERLRRILIEKVKEVPATDLETIREYIKEIKELGGEKEERNRE